MFYNLWLHESIREINRSIESSLIETMVPPKVLLDHHLKQLRLPTFIREHEKVAFECTQGEVDYQRFLLRLCELKKP